MNSSTQTIIQLIRPHIGQEKILRSRARFRVVACGRRFGKTEAGKLAIVTRFLQGERCWWLAPTYAMAAQVWRDLKAQCRGVPGVTLSEAERRMDGPGGGVLAIRSTFYADHLRGAGLDFVVLDEAAFMEASVWPEVVRPMLLERSGDALFLSSPNGRNWFWDIYQQGLDTQQPQWQSFHFSSYDSPLVPSHDLDDIRHSTPERVFREEYLAEFIDDAGLVFRGIHQAASAPTDTQPFKGRRYVAGVDWGRNHDYTVMAVIDTESQALVALERFNQVDWSLQRGRLTRLYDRWQPAMIWAEANSIGGPNIEALQAAGLPVRGFQMTAQSKAPLIEALALAIEAGTLALLPDSVLLSELAAYTLTRLPGGGYRYSAPAGQHDDTVIALALAWYGAGQGTVRVDFI